MRFHRIVHRRDTSEHPIRFVGSSTAASAGNTVAGSPTGYNFRIVRTTSRNANEGIVTGALLVARLTFRELL